MKSLRSPKGLYYHVLCAGLGIGLFPPLQAGELPQVDVQCGMVYSLVTKQAFGSWLSQIGIMGGPDWNYLLHLEYAPFVTVKNNTGWPLTLNSGGGGQPPEILFSHPNVGLRFERVGDSRAGFLTSESIPIAQMYVTQSFNVFSMNLMESGPSPAVYSTLQPGETKVFTPAIPSSAVFENVFDWQGNLMFDLQATAGWKGANNGYVIEWLVRQGSGVKAVNESFPVVPNRLADSWDVEIKPVGPLNGCRIFPIPTSPVATWPMNPDPESQVTQFPMNLTGFQSSTMLVQPTQAVATWQVRPLFSVLFPPGTKTGFITDRTRNGMNDEWEKHFFNGGTAVPNADKDGDGFSNLFEFLAGTSPVDASDFIRQSLVESDGGMRYEWSSLANRSYVVETSTDLKSWTGSEMITATGATSSHPISRPQTGQFFVRVRIVPPAQAYR